MSRLMISTLLLTAACSAEALPEGEEQLATAASSLSAGSCPLDQLFAPGVVATPEDENRLTFSPDGKTAYFHRFIEADVRLAIFTSKKQGHTWSTPTELPFTTRYNDNDPFVTLDGKRLYFSSDRPVDGSGEGEATPDWEIWYADRVGNGWGTPVHMGPEVNTPANELYPSTTLDGTLYYASDREGGVGGWDLYKNRRRGSGFGPAENLGEGINTPAWEYNPTPSPLGHVIFFGTQFREDTLGSDIYTSIRVGGEWLPGWSLGPCVNTEANEYHPSLNLSRGSLGYIRFDETNLGEPHEVSLF
jgi:hypothetical protein